MSFFYDGFLPFCPYELSATEFSNWNATNKAQWLQLNQEQVVRLYFAAKTFKCRHDSDTGESFANLQAMTYSGSTWASDGSSAFDVNWPTGEMGILSQCDASVAPNQFVCGSRAEFNLSGTLLSPVDSTFQHNVIRIRIFELSDVQGAGLTDPQRLLYRSGVFYVPVTVLWTMAINQAVYPTIPTVGAPAPPPTPKYFINIGRSQYSLSWLSSSTLNFAKPSLQFTAFGSTMTMRANFTSDSGANQQSFYLDIDESDPTQFFTP